MNRCFNRLFPVCRQLNNVTAVPFRSISSRRALTPWHITERQMDEIDRHFARLERDMHAAFRDWGFPIPRIQSFFEAPASHSSLRSRAFPTVETQAIPSEEAGKPGKYTIRVDMGEGFSPEDIKISLKDRMLTIQAKVEKKSEDGSSRIYQEVSRSFTLPESINVEELKSLISPDGVLTVEAPLPELEAPQPKEIPISIESKN